MDKNDVNKEMLQRCIKNVDIKEAGENSKLLIEFTEDATNEEVAAIKDFFQNMYSDFAKMLGISESELESMCKIFEDLDEEGITEEDYLHTIQEILQNPNLNNSALKKLMALDEISGPTETELEMIEKELTSVKKELNKQDEDKIIDLSSYRRR